jgi:hypothetical protein
MASNEAFASVVSIVGQNGKLALNDLAASATTCKDAQASIGGVMHEFRVPSQGPSGPHQLLLKGPSSKVFKMQTYH